ncbi:MAG: copper amine oxidase N-terminal domain-containing protein [Candidatus Ornithomonoglobus sp.]
MKKYTKILAVLAASAAVAGSLSSATAADDIKVLLDGNDLSFDVPPQIIDERTMVPLRAIFEAMGAAVDWDGDTQTVTAVRESVTVKMTVGSREIYVCGEPVTLDVPPQIVDDRTLVPARAVAEAFGAAVEWDGDARTVIITSAAEEASASEQTPAPTEAPTETEAAAQETNIPIENGTITTQSVSKFEITDFTVNSDGTYTIEYTFSTFLEGHGSVAVSFDCLDENGRVVDSFGGIYPSTDYTWSQQKDSAVIPGSTVKIVTPAV